MTLQSGCTYIPESKPVHTRPSRAAQDEDECKSYLGQSKQCERGPCDTHSPRWRGRSEGSTKTKADGYGGVEPAAEQECARDVPTSLATGCSHQDVRPIERGVACAAHDASESDLNGSIVIERAADGGWSAKWKDVASAHLATTLESTEESLQLCQNPTLCQGGWNGMYRDGPRKLRGGRSPAMYLPDCHMYTAEMSTCSGIQQLKDQRLPHRRRNLLSRHLPQALLPIAVRNERHTPMRPLRSLRVSLRRTARTYTRRPALVRCRSRTATRPSTHVRFQPGGVPRPGFSTLIWENCLIDKNFDLLQHDLTPNRTGAPRNVAARNIYGLQWRYTRYQVYIPDEGMPNGCIPSGMDDARAVDELD
ncbi:hypothetical protein DFH09DRAFT_1105984 [Mycena vulgaris]|nr:hypothetical protein DFH09DRAFT_1105984 [Mycena vulgaris]